MAKKKSRPKKKLLHKEPKKLNEKEDGNPEKDRERVMEQLRALGYI